MQQYLSAGPDDYITVIETKGVFDAGVVEDAAGRERI